MKKMKGIKGWMIKKSQSNTGREVILTMNRGEGLKSWTYAVVILIAVLALAVLLIQTPVHAFTCPTSENNVDTDNDGFTDYQECNGITLGDGSYFPGKLQSTGLSRGQYLDPETEDLFVILVPASPSNFPVNPQNPSDTTYLLQYVSNPISQGGLGITVHVISQNQVIAGTDRNVTSTQEAVRVTESLDATSTNPLGFSNTGTPDDLDLATIYTQRIINFVNSVYTSANASVPPGLIDTYIMHTIAHEVAHMLGPLAPVYNSNYGGYHYKSGTKVIMDQSIYYTSKKGRVTFYIGTAYTPADQAAADLSP
jgi:hypothetical protein